MGITPLAFTGASKLSSDLQTILQRAVQIAQLPLRALQNKDSDVLQRKTLLGNLASVVGGLATSLQALGTTAQNRALTATSSNTAAVTVVNSGATSAASYTIDSITSAASAASERSSASFLDSVATPVSANGRMKLVVGAVDYDFTLTNNSLVGLRDKINSLAAGVSASIITTSTGNYLSISANATGETTLQLVNDPAGTNSNILTATNQGTDAEFRLNGIPIKQPGNVVNSVISGLTFTILGATASPVTMRLETDRTQLASALSTFVTNYNAARLQVNSQVGPAAGLLSGHSVIGQLQNQLRNLTSYRPGSGNLRSLAELGIEFSNTGEASLNSTKFNALSDTQISDAFDFLGTTRTGLGGLSTSFSQFSDPIGGIIKTEQEGLDRIDKGLLKQMNALTDRVNAMQVNLARRLQQADSLMAMLESQQKQLGASLQGLNLVLYGKNQSS